MQTSGASQLHFSNLINKPTTVAGYGITDAMTTAHAANGITTTNITNWNTAFGWGNHAGLYRPVSYVPVWSEITSNPFVFSSLVNNQLLKYNTTSGKWENWTPNYLTGFTETDPLWTSASPNYYTKTNMQTSGAAQLHFNNLANKPTTVAGYGISDAITTAHAAYGITSTNITNWNAAFGWGNHTGMYRPISYVPAWSEITSNPFVFSSLVNNQLLKYNSTSGKWENWTPNYLTGFTETDPLWTSASANYYTKTNMQTSGASQLHFNNLTNKPTTVAGYGITDAITTAHAAYGITSTNITNWNTAFGWGNHAGMYRPISYVPAWNEITLNPFAFSLVASNQLIRYNSTSGKWENWTPNYLTGFTETDPLWTSASPNYYTKTNMQTSGAAQLHFNNLANKPTTVAGYGISDAITTAHAAYGITSTNITNWNAAFGWGNHTGMYRPISYVPAWSEITSNPFVFSSLVNNQLLKYNSTSGKWENWTPNYLTGFTETDPLWTSASANYYTKTNMQTSGASQLHFNNLTNKPTTVAGYGISDAITTAHAAYGITSTNITNWNAAFGWGNHAGMYRPISYVPAWSEITSNPFVFSSLVNNQLLKYNSTSGKWENWTPNYLTGFTETDPLWTSASANYYTKTNMQTSGASQLHFNNLTNKPTTVAGYGITDAHDNWGTQTVVADATLSGNGSSASPLKIAQQSATSGQVLKWSGSAWAPAADAIALPFSGTGTSGGPIFNIVNLGTSGAISTLSAGNYGIWGESASTSGIGVYGVNKTTSGTTYGVFGDVYSSSGFSGFFQGGKFYIQGNTGIGTQNPSAKLEVSGQVKITGGSPGTGKVLTSDGVGLATWKTPEPNLWLKNSDNIYFNAGDVGIGLNNPTGVLEIYGNSVDTYPQLLLSEEDGFARVSFRTMLSSSKHWVLAGHTNQTDGDSQWHLNYFNGTAGKNIFSVYGNSIISFDGKVGIGTTAPGALLQVHSNTTYADNVTPIIKISDNYKTWNIGLGDPGDRFSISSEENKDRLTILKANGFVGLGTTSPSAGLHLKANSWPGSFMYLEANAGSDAGIRFYESTTPKWHIYNNAALGGLQITNADAGTAIFAKQSNAFVGIGTTNPAYTLDVAGGVNIIKGLSGSALLCNNAQAIWYNGTYFSWGYGGNYNYFASDVTIGEPSAPGYNLVVNGSAAKTNGGSWSVLSDIRLKNIIGKYDKGLTEIAALEPVVFTYKAGNPRHLSCSEKQIGFIAQDVQKVFPEAVNECKDGYLDFNMHALNVAVINAIKELKDENDRLKSVNAQINTRLEHLEKLMENQAMK